MTNILAQFFDDNILEKFNIHTENQRNRQKSNLISYFPDINFFQYSSVSYHQN